MSSLHWIRLALVATLISTVAPAQQGDKAGEVQKQLVPPRLIPPAPALSPQQAQQSFKLARGFRLELVAAEPLVQDPVQVVFDPDGRLWVVEMRGYMPNVDGRGESAPIGNIAVLEDTDGDGRMDKRTVFLDQLVMPRAVGLVHDGVLVAEPPKLFFCRDTNGDLRCDVKEEVAPYAKSADAHTEPTGAAEHSDNGLLPALDNWIYSAKSAVKFRFDGESWTKAPTPFRGQWGISQDNWGRLVFNSNSDHLRVDLVPADYLARNPFLRAPTGPNWKPVKDQATWPIRVNPGVNRGYRADMLRPGQWTLAVFTAACAPVVYRGDQFPPAYVGDVFVCEPGGNFVRHARVTEKDGYLYAENPWGKAEFLASTDERFRPVNLANGPDGALYVVDMYRGILQHRPYMTTYLRQQILSRGLDQPIHLGRIWRIVAEGRPVNRAPQLASARPEQLVAALAHDNGWVRDHAQRLLVERRPAAALPLLRQTATTAPQPLARLHALWTLEGMAQLDVPTVQRALATEKHPKVLAAAIRVSESLLKGEAQPALLEPLAPLAAHPAVEVRTQLAFSLGQVDAARAEALLAEVAVHSGDHALVRDAVISSLFRREGAFITRLIRDPHWARRTPGAEALLSGLAQCIGLRSKGEEITALLDALVAARAPAWQTATVISGLAVNAATVAKAKNTKNGPRPKYIRVTEPPAALAALQKTGDRQLKAALGKLDTVLVWPSKPGAPPLPHIAPLTPVQQERFELGKALYEATCAGCHQPHGFGQDGLAPPLVDSEWVAGSVPVLTRIVLHGARGPFTVLGKKWDADMPSFGMLDDEQLAAVLTYIRREWEHGYDPVEPATVAKIRAATKDRAEAWTEAELKKVR